MKLHYFGEMHLKNFNPFGSKIWVGRIKRAWCSCQCLIKETQFKMKVNHHWALNVLTSSETHLLQINIICKLHVLGVDLKYLKSSSSVWNADVHLSVKAPWNQESQNISTRCSLLKCTACTKKPEHQLKMSWQKIFLLYRATLEQSDLTESPEGWVNAVGSVSGCHDNDMSPLLQSVHQSEQLRHNAPLHLTMSLRKQMRTIYCNNP